jgi:hypothetical protein
MKTNGIILNSAFVADTKQLSDVELKETIERTSESAKSQSQKIQAWQFLNFGKKVPESALEYIGNKFVIPKDTVRIFEENWDKGVRKEDKVFYQVPDKRLISFERIMGSHPDGRIYLDSLHCGQELTMNKTQFDNIKELLKESEKAHRKHSADVRLVQQFESSKKLFKSEVYLSLTRLKLKFLRNEQLTRKSSEVNAAARRIADMHKSFGVLELKTTVKRID